MTFSFDSEDVPSSAPVVRDRVAFAKHAWNCKTGSRVIKFEIEILSQPNIRGGTHYATRPVLCLRLTVRMWQPCKH